MNPLEKVKLSLQEKSGKKLAAFSVFIFLLVTAIVFWAAFELCRSIHLERMDGYLHEIPGIIESFQSELLTRTSVYEEYILTRAELGSMLYEEAEGTEAEKLEQTRSTVSAVSLSLVDGQRQILSSTGPVSPEEVFRACLQSLEPRSSHIEFYPAFSPDGEETDTSDGKGFVLFPLPGNTKRSLVFEFSCETPLELYNTLNNWPLVFERMLSGADAVAFVKTEDKLAGYPLNGLTPEQVSQLYEEVDGVFAQRDHFRKAENGRPGKLIKLMGRYYLAALTSAPEDGADILLAVPISRVIQSGICIAISISAIIGWGLMLVPVYVFRRLLQERSGEEIEKVSRRWLRQATWPGILVVVAVTVVFSAMLLLLENRSNTGVSAMTKRFNLQDEIDWHESQKGTARKTFEALYQSHAQTLAVFLSAHPDYQTHAGLEALNSVAGTDYLMLFDLDGKQLLSSNSYRGFAVGENLSEEYRAVLMGYPHVVVGPEADPYSGQIQLGAAVLMTDSEGQAEGFLLAVYSAEALDAALERMSYEYTVNHFAVQEGHYAAAINDADGRFIAHTDPGLIGQKAEYYLAGFQLGNSYEGFAEYNGKEVYISANSSNGRTLLYIMPERLTTYIHANSILLALAVLLILSLLYYPVMRTLSAETIVDIREKLAPSVKKGSPLKVFPDGYFIFLTLLAVVASITSAKGLWPSFVFVFSMRWSKGIHLFSLWAALFVLSVTLCCEYMLRTALRVLEGRLSLRAKTITRLVDSLITYGVRIFLAFCILDLFGVNTTTLLASAGVISIAVGMGAQSMASDLLAGFFMMLEGSVHVGDHVSVSGVTGYVTDMGIRTTEITDEDGNVVILNNSKVTGVRNMSRKQELQAPEDGLNNK